MLNDTYTQADLDAAEEALQDDGSPCNGRQVEARARRVAEAIAKARDEASKGALRLSAADQAEVRDELYFHQRALNTRAESARYKDPEHERQRARLRERAARVRHLITLFAALVLAALGCVADHDQEPLSDGPPLYVHLCDAMPAADQDAWGDAAAALNAEREWAAVWVGHGPPVGCDTVDVCPSSAVLADAETRVGACVTTLRYAPGTAHEVARQELDRLLQNGATMTSKQARKEYAGREMLTAAYKEDGVHHPRRNRRTHRAQSFRAWLRTQYANVAHVSPKLARILRSEPA